MPREPAGCAKPAVDGGWGEGNPMSELYKLSARALDGSMRSMQDCKGRVLLIVNVASGCGFTPQYAGLEALWRNYGARGLTVMGFPATRSAARSRATKPRSASSAA